MAGNTFHDRQSGLIMWRSHRYRNFINRYRVIGIHYFFHDVDSTRAAERHPPFPLLWCHSLFRGFHRRIRGGSKPAGKSHLPHPVS